MNPADWITPAQLAEQWSTPDQPVTVDWVRRQMAAGRIPSVKVGKKRFFTPACRAELERRAVPPPPDPSGFGYRGKRAS